MNLKEIALDVVKLGRTHDEEATRFLKSNEQRLNENFRRLKEATEEIMADFSDYYPKSEVDTLLSAKADTVTAYADLSHTAEWYGDTPSAVSLTTGSWKTVASVNIADGHWLLFATARFNSNATGTRKMTVSASADSSSQIAITSSDYNNAINGDYTFCHSFTLRNRTSTTPETLYVNAYQDSGSSLNCTGRIYAIRLG